MKTTTIRSERLLSRYKRADKVCRELRYLLANDGRVDGSNSEGLRRLLFSWMRASGKDRYERPRGR